MIKIEPEVKKFINDYKIDINNKDFKKIYSEAPAVAEPEIIGEFTEALLSSGIDPIKLDNNLNFIPDYYLYKSLAIDSLTIPNNINFVGGAAFFDSTLKHISFESGKRSNFYIYDQAFYNCDLLTSITLPSDLTMLGEKCFAFCGFLKHIYLPKSLYVIGDGCFYGTHMEEIEYEGTMKNFENILEKYFDKSTRGKIKYIKCSDGIYKLNIGNI